MEAENNIEALATDAAVSASASEPPAERPVLLDQKELRRKRSADYLQVGLGRQDPFQAVLAATNADLFGIASDIGDAIKQTLVESPPTLEVVGQLEPALNNYLRLARQFDRLMHLEARTSAARTRADEMKTQLQLLALQGHLKDATG